MKKLTRYITIAVTGLFFIAAGAGAMTFDAGDMGSMEISGAFKASFGATQYLDFVDDFSKGDDSDFDGTRELSIKTQWILNKNLKGVVSFQIGEGRSQGGYFGSVDAGVGGEEDGDIILELDNLYIDFTTDSGMNFKIGSQSACMGEIAYGSHIMYEVPAGVTFSAPLTDTSSLQAGWFRMADLMDDSEANTDDQADLLFVKLPVTMNAISFTPWAAYANIQEDVIANAPSHWSYAYFDYPGFLTGANDAVIDPTSTDDVSAWYLGMSFGYSMDALSVKASATYGDMDWETATVDASIAGYFADLVIDYKMDGFTPEFFTFYGNGPDANDDDFDMMPVLIGGPTYTSSYFGGSRFNDNMFDSYDSTYATSMWAVGFKLKDIKTGEKLSHEFQIMYAEGTAEDTIFQSPNDILMNEDESLVEINFNSTYQIMDHLLFATELGYMTFDEDSDYDEAADGSVEDFWKIACAIELSF
ncbi:MAG: outer membrane homotrimeric porin [Desulfobacterium sp.]